MDATCFTDRDDVTLGEWNAVSGQLTLECEVDGTGYYDIKVHNLLPWTLYTVWALFACSESHGDDPRCPGVDADGNPVGSPMYYNMMGGYSSVIMTDRKGYGAIDKPLSYCPLDTVNPLMVVNLLAHPDGVIWGGMPAGLKNLAPFAADHITFQVGDELLE